MANRSGGKGMSITQDVAFRGSTLRVLTAGDDNRDTIGYLHGMSGTPRRHPILAPLAATARRVIAPNLPGFSGSPACSDIRSLHDWVVATSEAIDVVGLTGCHVVAASVGAMLALEVAAVRPEAFSRLTLIAPFGLWDDDDPTTDPFATTLSNQRALLTDDPTVTSCFFDDQPGRGPADLVDDNVTRYATRTAAASLVWPIPEFGLATRIHRVTCPVALIWGAHDRLVPVSYLGRFAALLSNVTATHIIANAGHLADWDQPAAIAALI